MYCDFLTLWGFPGVSDDKESALSAGESSCISESEISPGEWQSTPVSLPGEFHAQRSLMGYSPWGHKELDTTE